MLVKRLIEQAMQGNSQAMKIVWDRIEGPARFIPPVQPVQRNLDLSLLTVDELKQYRKIVEKLEAAEPAPPERSWVIITEADY